MKICDRCGVKSENYETTVFSCIFHYYCTQDIDIEPYEKIQYDLCKKCRHTLVLDSYFRKMIKGFINNE